MIQSTILFDKLEYLFLGLNYYSLKYIYRHDHSFVYVVCSPKNQSKKYRREETISSSAVVSNY